MVKRGRPPGDTVIGDYFEPVRETGASRAPREKCRGCGRVLALTSRRKHLDSCPTPYDPHAKAKTASQDKSSESEEDQSDGRHSAEQVHIDIPDPSSRFADGQLADVGFDVQDVFLEEEMCTDDILSDDGVDEDTIREQIEDEVEYDHMLDSRSSVEALKDDTQPLHCTASRLDEYEVQALDTGVADGADGDGVDVKQRSRWWEARFSLIHDGVDPSTEMTVLQAAFHHIESLHKGSTLAQVEMDIKRALARYGADCGKPAPDNPKCRYPPSVYLCKIICDVGDLSDAEVHLCPKENCPHMTAFPKMPRPELLKHIKTCNNAACEQCCCPCGGKRMTDATPGCTPQPQAPCYFFEDVFEQFFLDPEWFNAASAAKQEERGNFFSNPEGQRILKAFSDAGADSNEVWPWELASDGVEMRNFTPHGTQVFLIRCAAVAEDLLCKARNVKPIMIVPGPSGPKSFAPYWKLILDLFSASSPLGGTKMEVSAFRSNGTASTAPVKEKVQMYLALHAVHMDYIMRAHVTHWYGPSADHPGGWCKCFRGKPVKLGHHAAKRAGTSAARVWGYQAQHSIAQPGLDGANANCGADQLQYSDAELSALGERTHRIIAALAASSNDEREATLEDLGIKTVEAAKAELRKFGRRGRIPWCDPRFGDLLAYISAGDLLTVPISHCLLRGLIRSLFVYALNSPLKDVPADHPVIFNTEARNRVKGLKHRLVFPSGFNRQYRCAVKYIKSYVMEELANLIFIGCYIAQCDPPGFKTLWELLQPAMLHYIFGFDDDVDQRAAAESSMLKYAQQLERLVQQGQVPERLLSPNLHCAVCRLPRQEAKRGNAARENELWMERYMNLIKARSKYSTITWVEKSFIRNTEATQRSLLRNRSENGCVSLYNHALVTDQVRFEAKGAGVLIKTSLKSQVRGLSLDNVTALAKLIICLGGDSIPAPASVEGVGILDDVKVWVHTSAAVGRLKFDSRHTPSRSANSRSYQNSFVRLPVRDVVSTLLDHEGRVQYCPQLRALGRCVYAQIECFVHAQTARAMDPDDVDHVYAVVQVLKSPSRHRFVGTETTVTAVPEDRVSFEDMYVVAIQSFQAQLLLLKASGTVENLRFVECPEKLNML